MKSSIPRQAVALLLALPLTHQAALAVDKIIWSEGHGDLGVSYVNGAWRWFAKDGLAVGETIVNLRDNARASIPASPSFAFLGAAGDPVWIIPATQQLGVPFMGANHELTPPGTFVNGRFDLRLSSVDGPGDFIMWTVSGGGQPNVLMNSRDGVTPADVANAPAPGHWHQNWGFTAPGTYRVGYIAGGILAAGGQAIASKEQVYTFAAGVLRGGEADIEVAYESGELKFLVHDEGSGSELDPAHVALHAGPAAWRTVPTDPAFAFLGAPGGSIHVFPQDENEAVLFLGLAGGEVPPGTFVDDTIQVRLTGFSGPGQFFHYQVDPFGAPKAHLNTADGLSAADAIPVVAGSHAHHNWAFTEPGVYRLTLEASAQLASGGAVTSRPATFLFEIFGPEFLDRGEIDLEIAFKDGAFELALLDEAMEKEFCPADAVLVARAPAATTVPNDPRYRFLGNPGAVVHILPQEETGRVLFLGNAADEIASGQFAGESVSLLLASLDGPGNLALYSTDAFGTPAVYWNSADGLTAADAYPAAVGSHAHNNWAFTAPGVYRVGLKAVGTLADSGQPVESGVVNFTFLVKAPAMFEHGELDFEIAYSDGEWEMALLDEAAGGEYEADEAILVAAPAAMRTVPGDPAFGFLGAPGASTHVLPQEETEGVLFLGIAGDEIEPGKFAGDGVSLQLLSVSGPGLFALYTVDPFGAPAVFMNSGDGVSPADSFPVAVGGHTHVNWAFSAPGSYQLVFKAVGTLADGGASSESKAVTLSFAIQAGGPTLEAAPVGGGAEIRIGWNSEPGVSYQLQSRTTFGVPGWTNEGAPISGVGGPQAATLPRTDDTLKVFRIVVAP